MNALGDWYVKTKSGASGPHSIDALRRSAAAGKLPKTAMLSQSPSGPWIAAGTIKVLFPEKEFTAEDLRPSDLVPDAIKDFSASAYDAIRRATTISTQVARDKLDSMAEAREQAAREKREAKESREAELARNREEYFSKPDPVVKAENLHLHIHQHRGYDQKPAVHVTNVIPQRRWSRGVAMVLSFLIPGLGQIYKRQLISGLCWFFMAIVGYILFIIPGMFIHLCCIIGASMGDEYR